MLRPPPISTQSRSSPASDVYKRQTDGFSAITRVLLIELPNHHTHIGRHNATGWWLEEAGGVEPRPPLSESIDADVLVIGGGYTGMWTAWQLLEAVPAH